MNSYAKSGPGDAPVVTPAPREDRQFLHAEKAGIVVPLLQSVATAVIIGMVVLTLWVVNDWQDAWRPTVTAMVFALAGWWMVSLRRWMKLTERDQPQVAVRGVDHDNNPATPMVVRVQLDKVGDGRYQQTAIFDLNATPEQMSALANGLLNMNRPFSEAEWTGAGKPFSVNGFRTVRSDFIKRNLLTLKNEKDVRQGYVLTAEGAAVLEEFLS